MNSRVPPNPIALAIRAACPAFARKPYICTLQAACLSMTFGSAFAACPNTTNVSNGTGIDYAISNVKTGTSCLLASGDTLNIGIGGSLTGDAGNNAVQVAFGVSTGNITNAGTITNAGRYPNSIFSQGWNASIFVGGGTTGDILNSGTLQATRAGTGIGLINGTVGNLVNTGTIVSVSDGIELATTSNATYLAGASDLTTVQSITNSGTITGNSALGIYRHGGVTGDILNDTTGNLIASVNGGVYMSQASAGNITNRGTIAGKNWAGAYISSSTIGSILNTGTISATASRGLYIVSTSMVQLTNEGVISGTLSGVELYGNGLSGDFVNSLTGTITGTNGYGVRALGNAVIDGNFHNSGSITGSSTGLAMEAASTIGGDFINDGSILGGSASAVLVTQGSVISGDFINNAGATLVSTSLNGMQLEGTGTSVAQIINAGSISGNLKGVLIDAGASVGVIQNSGAITAIGTSPNSIDHYAGIAIHSVLPITSITNSGTIAAEYAALGIYGGTVGSIVNATGGQMNGTGRTASAGSGYAMWIDDAASIGSVSNAGTLNGLDGGVYVTNASTLGSLSNTGTITGGDYAVHVGADSAITSGVTNSNLLDGRVELAQSALYLSGNAARVTGATTGLVNSSVEVQGTFTNESTFDVGGFNILSGARLNLTQPVGIVDAITVQTGSLTNRGTLAIEAGTIARITGTYEQDAAGILEIGLTSPTTYGQLAVSGAATLPADAKVHVDLVGAPALANRSVQSAILSAGTLNSPGTFAVTDDSLLFDFLGVVNGNSVDLCTVVAGATSCNEPDPVVPPDPIVPPAPTPESTGVVRATHALGNTPGIGAALVLDQFVSTVAPSGDLAELITALGRLTSEEQVSNAVSQVLPLYTGAGAQATNNAMRSMNRIIQARIESNRGLSSGDDVDAENFLWAKPFGAHASQDTRDSVAGFSSDTFGVAVGVDRVLGDRSRIGGAATFANVDVGGRSNIAPQEMDVTIYQLVGYGSYNIDHHTGINWQLDVGKNKNEGERSIGFGGLDRVAQSDYDSLSMHVSLGLGRLIQLSSASNVTPSLRLDYTRVETDSYTETGAGALNLRVDGEIYDELLVTADMKAAHTFENSLTIFGNLAAAYDLMNDPAQATSAFVGGGPVFITNGLESSPWLMRGGVGLARATDSGLELSVRYDTEARTGGFLNQTFSARMRKRF